MPRLAKFETEVWSLGLFRYRWKVYETTRDGGAIMVGNSWLPFFAFRQADRYIKICKESIYDQYFAGNLKPL